MFNINTHRLILAQILRDIFLDFDLAPWLGFKGGTALMFFYHLPRFSVDLNFNLLDPEREKTVFEKLKILLAKYGNIHDAAIKHFGSVLVLDYEKNGRKLKVEVSNRMYENHYEEKNFYGVTVTTMTAPDMFAHKLCALLDRSAMTNRDIFDCWFFMDNKTPVNPALVEYRMKQPPQEYLERCIKAVEAVPRNHILDGMGDLMDEKTKDFVRNKLIAETSSLLQFYRDYPIEAHMPEQRPEEGT
jgi:hypothetical protein